MPNEPAKNVEQDYAPQNDSYEDELNSNFPNFLITGKTGEGKKAGASNRGEAPKWSA